jgi:hypothetical protein
MEVFITSVKISYQGVDKSLWWWIDSWPNISCIDLKSAPFSKRCVANDALRCADLYFVQRYFDS